MTRPSPSFSVTETVLTASLASGAQRFRRLGVEEGVSGSGLRARTMATSIGGVVQCAADHARYWRRPGPACLLIHRRMTVESNWYFPWRICVHCSSESESICTAVSRRRDSVRDGDQSPVWRTSVSSACVNLPGDGASGKQAPAPARDVRTLTWLS